MIHSPRLVDALFTLAAMACGPAIDAQSPAADFYAVAPCRVLDSRSPVGTFGGPSWTIGSTRGVTLAGQCGIATSAIAVSANITVVSANANGYLTAYATGDPLPNVSTISFASGVTRANNAVLELGEGGGVNLYGGFTGGTADVIVDVNGYFDSTVVGAVAPPALSPPPGSYGAVQYVSLTSSTVGAAIRYTTDGSAPSAALGTLYDGTPVKLSSAARLLSIAYTDATHASAVSGGSYDITPSSTLFIAILKPQSGAATLAAGNASLLLSGDQTSAVLYETYSNLTGPLTGQHIHEFDTSIVFDIDTAPAQEDGSHVWQIAPVGIYTPAQLVADLFAGRLYLNLHTAAYPGGEIKGYFQLATGSQTFTPPPAPPALPPPPPTARDAARFLAQATWGASLTDISALQTQGFDGWLNAQFAAPVSPYTDDLTASSTMSQFWESFWKHVVTKDDQLRQRVAVALSEIFVTSAADSGLAGQPLAMSTYFDTLSRDAFGNLRQLLEDVTLRATMGRYLDMLKNDKENLATGRIPNENYAREVLQLFTVGLNRVFPDGTLQLGTNGLPIATYDQDTVIGFAHVFTGWSWGDNPINETTWRNPTPNTWTFPMQVWPTHHSAGTKLLLRGVTLPANQTPEADLGQALDNIFTDPNVGPFLCRGLIQRLVTSNPSPAYVYRCDQAFENNGLGVRGDLKSVIRAILLDYEARAEAVTQQQGYGHQREPMMRLGTLLRTFHATSVSGKFPIHNLDDPTAHLGQTPLRAPTVFNFFPPEYVLPGATAAAGVVAPEFEITTVVQAIGSANYFRGLIYNGLGPAGDRVTLAYDEFLPLAGGADTGPLVDRLSLALTAQGVPASMRAIMVTALNQLPASNPTNRVKAAVRMIMMSPTWVIEK
ncbi:MAG: DUF1800 family protein [Pseudolysinimonas sp.]